MRPSRIIIGIVVAILCVTGCSPDTPPNVVVILVDDLGIRDTGVYGSPYFETPAIDRLASEGVRFSHFYTASPVCSPTRASLMTGRHPARLRITNWIGGEQQGALRQAEYRRELPLEEVTLGERFTDAGYRTGYIGKWHLGQAGFKPEDQGFEYVKAVNDAGQPGSYFPPYQNPGWSITDVPDLELDDSGAYLTDRLTDFAVSFIDSDDDRPFLLVLSHYAVHTPLQAPEKAVEAERARLPAYDSEKWVPESGRAWANQHQDNPVYAAMVASTDESVRRVMSAVSDRELDQNTIIAFVSDNGGLSTLPRQWAGMATSNAPLRAGKGWLYEGGIAAPLIVRWPDRLSPGSVRHDPVTSMDLMPTLTDLAGLTPTSTTLDGRSLAPGASDAPRTLYWYFPHYHGSGNRPSAAIRRGLLKLVYWFEGNPSELYDLAADPYESHDIASALPDTVRALETTLMAWLHSVDAEFPSENPDWEVRP